MPVPIVNGTHIPINTSIMVKPYISGTEIGPKEKGNKYVEQ
jgi:hypothetical protein